MKLIDLQDKCWIALSNEGFPGLRHSTWDEVKPDLTQKELEFYGRKFMMPRLTAWYGDGEYRYSGTVNPAKPMPPSVKAIRDTIESRCSKLPGFGGKDPVLNSVLINFYRDGKDSVDWHSDDASQLGPTKDNVLIASLTIGNPRKFVLRNKKTRQKISFELETDDLLIMGGQTQKFWEHKIPKTSKKVGERLNLTFRCYK